jgi:tRNA(Arg) A34 adenosine deaminase TadA
MGKPSITAYITNKQGHTLTIGNNSYTQTHPVQAQYSQAAHMPDRIFLHAEIAALVQLRKGMKPYKIAIERYGKDGRSRLARPCPACEAAIKAWGIKRVEYTT